ncbi:hypothetical protein [Prosthecobacter sp.]|uniref:hypothetical protein n=1 Tax=Prosthecobacter sp. TaxID=1965333 RepID=UPI0037841941
MHAKLTPRHPLLRMCCLVLSLTIAAWQPGHSADGPPAAAGEIPQVSETDMNYATQTALAQGVLTLKKFAQADPQGWIIPPIQKVTLTGYKDVPLKYRLIERDVPIYEYTDMVVLTPGPSPGDPPVRRIVQQPTKQIGTRKETHIRYDPNGPLERIYKQPIYEHVGDTSWSYSLIGDSAMALTALRAAGVPENDPVMVHMVENLMLYLDTYGPPDQTWNVAWLAVAMAQTDDSIAADWAEKLASRLLDGQITDGPARGLWGPMCFHPRLISVLISDYLASEAEVNRMQAKQKERPTKANQVLLSQAEGARNRLKKYADSWTHLALKFATVEFPMTWEDMMTEKVQFAGATDFFYNQRSADMESTWVALHALSVCAETKHLPKTSQRPLMPAAYDAVQKIGATATGPKGPTAGSQMNEATVPPEAAMAVLARAANALVALLPERGGWSECNFHQPVKDFDAFSKFLAVPVDPASFPALDSPVTATSAAMGISALDSIGRAVGMDKLAKFQTKYNAGAMGRNTAYQELLKVLWPKPAQRPQGINNDRIDLFLPLMRPLQGDEPDTVLADEITTQLIRYLILGADADGAWGAKLRRTYITSSSRARFKALENLPGQVWKAWRLDVPVELNKAHISLWHVTPSNNSYYNNISPGSAYATAIAVYYLASRVKNPGAVLEKLCVDPTLADQRKSVDALLLPQPRPKPKPAPVVAAKPAPTPEKPAQKPGDKAMVKAEEIIPVVPIKPADTQPKKDETF